jgi:hypothetical protein
MPKALSETRLADAKRSGYVYPVPVVSRDKARHYLDLFEDYERNHAHNAPRKLMVKAHILFPWMIELGTTPALLDAVEDLIGPDIMLTISAVWVKNGNDPSFTTWHQDSAYFGFEPLDVWGAWVGLTDSLVEHGCLRYKPGSHLKDEMAHIETWEERNLLARGQLIPEFDETGVVDAEVRAGEATLHHFRTAHSSKPNTTGERRIGILFVYCPPHVRPTLGRFPARCVRGVDRHGHYDPDPEPKRVMDPDNVEFLNRLVDGYFDPEVRSEAERKAAAADG